MLKLTYYKRPTFRLPTGCSLVGVFDDKGVQTIGVWHWVVI